MTDHEILEALLVKMNGLTDTVGTISGRVDSLSGKFDSLTDTVGSLSSRVDGLSDAVTRVAVTQENMVLPQLAALAEGHKDILEKLTPRSRIDQMQEQIDLLMTIVKTNTQQISELKNAM